jgi:adenylate cyclase
VSTEGWMRTPGRGTYARIEREQRYLLAGVPVDAGPPRLIEDLYVTGTSLRVRRTGDGVTVVGKLTQKVRPIADDPTEVSITNIYLSEAEVVLLSELPGHRLRKHRRPWTYDGRTWAVDEHDGRWAGLVVAELESDQPVDVAVRPPFLADVTRDERFTGATMAAADDRAVTDVLAWVREFREP